MMHYSETGRTRALLRPFSNRVQVVDEMPADGAPAVFYHRVVSDRRGLPYSEGVVVKDNNDLTGRLVHGKAIGLGRL
jgi:hypothetical protein